MLVLILHISCVVLLDLNQQYFGAVRYQDLSHQCILLICLLYQSLPRVVGPYTLSNLYQRLKSSPVFSDHVIVKLSCDQTGSSQNGGLTFVTCGFAFSLNTRGRETIKNRVFRLQYTKQQNNFFLHGIYALFD